MRLATESQREQIHEKPDAFNQFTVIAVGISNSDGQVVDFGKAEEHCFERSQVEVKGCRLMSLCNRFNTRG